MEYIVYTDGGCNINPGGAGGYGVVIIDKDTAEITELNGGFICTTNNRMEIFAVIAACEWLPINSKATVYSDSSYVVNTMNGNFVKKKNHDLWKRLGKAVQNKEITFKWIRGHKGNKFNERCDELAAEGYMYKAIAYDDGYDGQIATPKTSNGKGAMGVIIDIEDTEPPKIDDTNSYAKERNIKPTLARQMKKFYKSSRHTFTDYAKLKTDGIDGLSRKNEEYFKTNVDPTIIHNISELLPYEKDMIKALRWYCRGLTVKDSVRKVLVDNEISDNAIKSKNHPKKKKKYLH